MIEDSFFSREDDTAKEIVERIKKQLIENGARVVGSHDPANYVIFEDGYD